MKTRQLGNIAVSEIGMGCMGFSHGYGKIPDETYSIEAIQMAYDYGCTFFDTAEGYGPNLDPAYRGHNEKILGKAFEGIDRESIVIATKLHISTEEAHNGLYPVMKAHLLKSLDNLRTDYADLYYLHRMNPDIAVEAVAETMHQLYDEKLIRGWGLSQVPVKTIDAAHKVFPVSGVQNIYSMVERGIEEEVIPYCIRNNIGIVPFSPTASGLLSGKITAETEFEKVDDVRNFVPQLKRENIIMNQPIIDLLREYASLKKSSPAQISLAWMLHKYPNVVPIPGSKNKERIMENLKACEVELTDEEFSKLDQTLDSLEVFGYRGFDETRRPGGSMKDWDRKRPRNK